jgi:hypothetical protein
MNSILFLFALNLPLSAAISFTLPGIAETSSWELNRTNYLSVTSNTFRTATIPWVASAIPTSGTSSALFNKVSGGGYMATTFMYTAPVGGSFRLYDESPLAEMETIVMQGYISDALDGMPVFNFNGGSQSIPASFSTIVSGATYPARAWQWDLSGVVGPIHRYEILFSGHFAATSLRVDSGNTFFQVIPEPSSALLACSALGFTLIRRRRV